MTNLLLEELPADHRSGFLAVIGRPNVGKSTLLNRVLGQKIAITSPKPQTTRDQLLGILTQEDAQIMLLDTPGIHAPRHKLGRHMVTVAEEAIRDVDVVLWLVDSTVNPTEEDVAIAALLADVYARQKADMPVVIGLNKVDRLANDAGDGAIEGAGPEGAYLSLLDALPASVRRLTIRLSALTGEGVEPLLTAVRELLPPGPRYYPSDQVTDLQTRFIVAELIREQALQMLQQEVPHSVAVVVDEFTERSNTLIYISAIIYVERDSQKGIVLGKGGRTIKQIGQAARPEIEELVGAQVYLELWVKVWEKWRRREGMLRRLGYAVA